MRLGRKFFLQPTLKVAKELLGKYIFRKYKDKLLIGKIVETEAYIGPKDKASHAYSKKEQAEKEKLKIIHQNWERIKNYVEDKEKFIKKILKLKKAKVTKRNLTEYLKGGHIYIYLIYGNYYQLNITTYKEGYPECVLIRSLEPVLNLKNPKGPGKLCEELYLDKSFWGEDLCKSDRIWLVNHVSNVVHGAYEPHRVHGYTSESHRVYNPASNVVHRAKRIGIDYAGEDANLLWRFYIKNNQWVSKR